MLVREFDDRFGLAKWSFASCAEWLAWRCGMSLSAAREKVRTAHALRALPAISAAFADGRLSYSKVRALTRVADAHDEDLLLAYALDATAAQVEERCRQIRNVAPESRARRATRVGAAFADGVPRSGARHAADHRRAAGRGRRAHRDARSTTPSRPATSRPASSSTSIAEIEGQRLARAAGRCARRDREGVSRRAATNAADGAGVASRRSLPSRRARRRDSPPRRDRPLGSADRDRQAPHVRRQLDHGRRGRARHAARRRPQAAHGVDAAQARALVARSRLHVPGLPAQALSSTRITSSIGSTAARRASTTSRCSARITTAAARGRVHDPTAIGTARSISGAPTGA